MSDEKTRITHGYSLNHGGERTENKMRPLFWDDIRKLCCDKTPPFKTWSGEEDFQESCSRTWDVACCSFLDKAAVRLSL